MKFAFSYTAIRVRDLDRAARFYQDVLGMSLQHRGEVAETKGEVAVFQSEGAAHRLEVNWYAEDSPVAGPYQEGEELDHLAFEVEDLDAALGHLRDHGYSVVHGVIQGTGARWAYVKDPDGIWIEVFERLSH